MKCSQFILPLLVAVLSSVMPSFATAEQADLPLEVSMTNACLMTPDDADFLLQTMIAVHNDLENDITYESGALERMEVSIPSPDPNRALEDLTSRRKLPITWGPNLGDWWYWITHGGSCNGCGGGRRTLRSSHSTRNLITWGSSLSWRYYYKITGTCNGCGSRDLTAEDESTHAHYEQTVCAALLDGPHDCFENVENCSISVLSDAP